MSVYYYALIYNAAGALRARLNDLMAPSWTRTTNGADEFTLRVPRGSTDIIHLGINSKVELFRAGVGTAVATGIITDRTYGADAFEVTCYTEEILMERVYTPAQYGYVLRTEYPDLGDFAETMAYGWYWQRVKYPTQWSAYITASSNIDYNTNPGMLILAKDGGGDFFTSGYVELRFQSTVNFTTQWDSWDRFRWSADYSKGDIAVTVQYNYLGGPGFGTAFGGALTDTVGFAIPNPSAGEVYFRLNLSTTDTTRSPTVFGCEMIARTDYGITISTNVTGAQPYNVQTPLVNADSRSALDVMVDAMKLSKHQFRIVNGELDVQETFGADKSNDLILVAE